MSENAKKNMSLSKLIVFCILIFMALVIIMPALGQMILLDQKKECNKNLKAISVAMQNYASNHDGILPSADSWCDLLIIEENVHLRRFRCMPSCSNFGESAYAMNINASGRKLSDLPEDMALLFEVDCKEDDSHVKIPLSSRHFAQQNAQDDIKQYLGREVRRDLWNQVGELEQAAPDNHWGKEKQCNVLFANGRVKYVNVSKLPMLMWNSNDTANHYADLPTNTTFIFYAVIIVLVSICIAWRCNIIRHCFFATVLIIISGAVGAFFGKGAEYFYIFAKDAQQGIIAGAIFGVAVAIAYSAILVNKRKIGESLYSLHGYAIKLGIVAGIICSTLVHIGLLMISDNKDVVGIILGLPCGLIAGLILGGTSGSMVSMCKATYKTADTEQADD